MRRLYHYPLDAFSRQIRVCLMECNIEHELFIEFPWNIQSSNYLQFPCDFPTFVDVDGTAYHGWYAIVEHLNSSGQSVFGNTEKEKAECRRLVSLFNELFYADVTRNIVYEKVIKRYSEHASPDSSAIRRGNNLMKQYLDYIEWLTDRRNWLAGDDFSFADIVTASHISCLDYVGNIEWEKFSIVKDWYVRIKSRPSFRGILHDRVQNITPPEYYQNLDF